MPANASTRALVLATLAFAACFFAWSLLGPLGPGLQDHLGFPYAICRHVNDADPDDLKSISAASVVMNLDEREFLYSSGPPCDSPYERVDLATVFG